MFALGYFISFPDSIHGMSVRLWPTLRPKIYGCSRTTLRRASSSSSNPPPSSAFTRLLSRTPQFLRPTVSALHNAPVAHVTAFLLLHEITAVLPLFGLAGLFHYYHWLPQSFTEGEGGYVEKFARYARKKGWIGKAEVEQLGGCREGEGQLKWWNDREGGVRWVIEFATAYAVVKALLPLRIVLSVWGAPWFARWTVIPVGGAFKRLFATRVGGRNASKATGPGSNVTAKSGSAKK